MKSLNHWFIRGVLFVVCCVILLFTMPPTIYTLDSAEFVLGAKTLGIIHAPGYPLYLIIAHLFTLLPIGDLIFRVSLFSVLCLAATASVLYSLIYTLLGDRLTAVVSALVFVWSFYAWINGLVAEVYAPQLLILSLVGWGLAKLYRQGQEEGRGCSDNRLVLLVGLGYGVAVALAPSSILFALGMVVSLLLLKIRWRDSLAAGLIAVFVFGLTLLYFPIRYAAKPSLNMAGTYNPAGEFKTINLQTPSGIWTVISGKQFENLFFANGYIPTVEQIENFLGWFVGNFFGVGIAFGIAGICILFTKKRSLFIAWACFLVPYTYFFLVYGADDVKFMLSPIYLIWMVVFAYGLQWALDDQKPLVKIAVSIILTTSFLALNYPRVDVSDDSGVYDKAKATMEALPENSLVFGPWLDIVPLQYLHEAEEVRPDVKLYNLFLFNSAPYFSDFEGTNRPIVMLDEDAVEMFVDQDYYRVTSIDVPDESVELYEVTPIIFPSTDSP